MIVKFAYRCARVIFQSRTGGKVVATPAKTVPPNTFIISTEQDLKKPLKDLKVPVRSHRESATTIVDLFHSQAYEAELILAGVLRQSLDLEQNLSVDVAALRHCAVVDAVCM